MSDLIKIIEGPDTETALNRARAEAARLAVEKEFTVAIQAEVTPSSVSNVVNVINDTGIVVTLSYFGATTYRLTFASPFVGASDLVYPASFIINEEDGRLQNLIVSRASATRININASDDTGLANAGAMFIIKIRKP